PTLGCKPDVECKADADCTSQGCGRCDNGACSYGCDAGQVCCNNSCQACCSATDCFDGIDCTDNACIDGKCKFTPNNKLCPVLKTCNVRSEERRVGKECRSGWWGGEGRIEW